MDTTFEDQLLKLYNFVAGSKKIRQKQKWVMPAQPTWLWYPTEFDS